MGFLAPKPKINVIEPTPAPTIDDDQVRRAADEAAQRAGARRSSADTIEPTSARRRGGLAQASRKTTGSNPNA
jgi:hypothetical protein